MARTRDRTDVRAAIDIGSYSVHLLVAEVARHRLAERLDESAFLGLGRELDVAGRLAPARPRVLETIGALVSRAKASGASEVTIVGTDPLRRAPDAAELLADIAAVTGVRVEVLTHEEEALAALIGVQAGRPIVRDTVVVDVGGGSTEVLVAGPAAEARAVGLPLGVTRLTGRYVAHDPPTGREVAAIQRRVTTEMKAAPAAVPAELVAVGGTARSLLRVGPRLANRVLSRRRVRRAQRLIGAATAADLAERYDVRHSRALMLAAGAAILAGAMDRYELSRLRVAKGGLREGLLLAAHRAGPGWRHELRDLARGWDR